MTQVAVSVDCMGVQDPKLSPLVGGLGLPLHVGGCLLISSGSRMSPCLMVCSHGLPPLQSHTACDRSWPHTQQPRTPAAWAVGNFGRLQLIGHLLL